MPAPGTCFSLCENLPRAVARHLSAAAREELCHVAQRMGHVFMQPVTTRKIQIAYPTIIRDELFSVISKRTVHAVLFLFNRKLL